MNAVQTLSWDKYEKAPGLSQSKLKVMAKTPAHFKEALDNPPEPTRSFIMGHFVHTAVLEPNLLQSSYHLRPETYTLEKDRDKNNRKGDIKKWNGNATECKDWFAAHTDKEVVLQAEQDAMIQIRKAVLEHPEASRALTKGKAEQCLFANDPVTGLQLKCRTDWLSGEAIVDLKTCEDASPAGFAKSVAKYGYDVQAAFNLDIANLLSLGKEYFVFIAVEKEPPHAVAVYDLDIDSIALGRSKYRRWLDLYAHCSELDEWPGYDPKITTLRLPQWSFMQESNLLLEG